MAEKIVFPYHPVNKFHAGIKANFEAAAAAPHSIDLLTSAIETGSTDTQTAIGKVATAITNGFKTQPTGQAIDKKLDAIGQALKDLNQTVQSFGLRDKDNVTALYAAAVDTTGDIVDRTHAGQWLNQAKFASLQTIVAFHASKPQQTRRDEFIKRVRAVDPVPPGLPAVVTDGELARFFELAPAVLKAIADSQPTGGGQQSPTPTA